MTDGPIATGAADPNSGEVTDMPESLFGLIEREIVPLYMKASDEAESFQTQLLKAAEGGRSSRQGVKLGEQPHPYDFAQTKSFLTGNEYHSTCIHTKVASTVGLGFIDSQEEIVEQPAQGVTPTLPGDDPATMPPVGKTRKQYVDSKVDLALNELCMISATDLLHDACEDFWQTGNGYIEVVREIEGDAIVGLHHLPCEEVFVWVEDIEFNYHYFVKTAGDGDGRERRFAKFGDHAEFKEREGEEGGAFETTEPDEGAETYSEVIHFRRPTSRSRFYGMADWLSAVPPIELAQMLLQWKYDFFLNRGVPEFIFLLVGQRLKKEDWKKVEDGLRANIGLGNSHKSMALNIDNPEVRAQVEKLAAESKGEDTFDTTKTSLGMSIVTAHRVPPLLAGIQIPGKLGATNELPNALMSFQILVIGPAQRLWQQTLACTLGSDNGLDGLAPNDFAFTKITEEINVGSMDTVSRMRQSPMQAQEEGRDLGDGVKE